MTVPLYVDTDDTGYYPDDISSIPDDTDRALAMVRHDFEHSNYSVHELIENNNDHSISLELNFVAARER